MRILLTGGGGFLGGIICRELGAEHQLTLLTHTRSAPAGTLGLPLDLAAMAEAAPLHALLEAHPQDAVLHTAALSNPNQCQLDPGASHRLNVRATQIIADVCAARGLPLAFTSTDLVFDGTRGLYAEDDAPNPLSLYGEHKALAERAVLERHPLGGLVCRLPLLYGASPGGAPCFLDGFLAQAARAETLRLFEDEFRSPLHAVDAAHGLLLGITSGVRGVLHLGGPERLSRLEFGLLLQEALARLPGAPAVRIQATRQADMAMAAPRPRDVSFSSARAAALGFRPAMVRQALPQLLRETFRPRIDSGPK